MKKPYFIAELGVNFYDTAKALKIPVLDAAKLYVKEAAAAGVDACKFQSYKADTIVSKNSPAYWDLTKEPTPTQYDLFKKHDSFGLAEFTELAAYCRDQGVDFLSTPFDYDSADYLESLMPAYKISSSDLSNLPFIRHMAAKGKPIYLSVGASYESEIDEAVREILKAGCPRLVLLHCVLSYPTRYEDANLAMIKRLKTLYPELEIGYSDHTMPDESMTVLSMAYLYGATVIEKHFTLDKTLSGNDHYHAGEPTDFAKAIRNFALITALEGQERREVLPCEEIPRREARRSLVLTRDVKAGEVLTARDLTAKRPGTGVPPRFADVVIGQTLSRDLPEDSVLDWHDF